MPPFDPRVLRRDPGSGLELHSSHLAEAGSKLFHEQIWLFSEICVADMNLERPNFLTHGLLQKSLSACSIARPVEHFQRKVNGTIWRVPDL